MSRASRRSVIPNACPRATRRCSWEERCRKSTSGDAVIFLSPLGRLSHMAISVVSTGARSAERRDLLSTISGLSWREGLSARACGPRSRRRGVAICNSPPSNGGGKGNHESRSCPPRQEKANGQKPVDEAADMGDPGDLL